MKRFIFLAALCLVNAGVQAKGVPFAMESFQKAQQAVKHDASRHVLVFYTSEN
jgi:hypothetical protein